MTDEFHAQRLRMDFFWAALIQDLWTSIQARQAFNRNVAAITAALHSREVEEAEIVAKVGELHRIMAVAIRSDAM
jgi:hypothetical protein